ncbi:MAG: imidazole glycerol phosphate synthase subunit HisH [Ruminococcaceae bacterium]|nr:imidazole glycerol phosphate synthase subunit HisH [Oscillospiraceae bacterium]
MIAIIDYKAGNLRSVEKAFLSLGHDVSVTDDAKTILSCEKVILPGVGSFSDAMNSIKNLGLDSVIRDVIDNHTPFLGICLGMQLMYEESEEGDGEGFGILKGKVKRFPQIPDLKIPQIGWNNLNVLKKSPLLEGIGENPFVYFVHSYYVDAEDLSTVTATVDYGVKPHVLVEKDNLFLAQFHPEKSGKIGLKMLDNFAKLQVII